MRRNHPYKKQITEATDEMVAAKSIAPIQKALAALYTQLDKERDEHEQCARQAATDRTHTRVLVWYMRAKLVARCDGDIMSGAFDRLTSQLLGD